MVFETLLTNDISRAVMFVIGAVLGANLLHFILRTYVRKFAAKTQSDLDDQILTILLTPLYLFITLGGLYLGLRTVTRLESSFRIIDNIAFVLGVVIVSIALSRLIALFVSRWLKMQHKYEKTPMLISKTISILIYIIALLMILVHFKVEITPLLATLGVGGLAVGLALQNTLANYFAGLHILSDRPIKVGDFIELEDGKIAGYVHDIGWRSTRIQTLPNTIVVIPNAKLAESIIINNSQPMPEMSVVVQCGVDYGSDLDRVEKATIDAAKTIQKTIPGAVKDFEPFIRYHTFGESNINFSIILRVHSFVDKYLVIHEFIKALKKRYDKEGIEISWPVRKQYQMESKR